MVKIWQQIIVGNQNEHGTCVVLMEPEENPADQAKEILKE